MVKTLETAAPLVKLCYDKNASRGAPMNCTVRHDLFEYGGVFEGERSLSEEKRRAQYPNPVRGLKDRDILERLPGVGLSEGCTPEGWWTGGKESDAEYLTRVQGIVDWLWTLDESSLLITHGKTLDTLLKVALGIPHPLETRQNSSDVVFLHGGCALSCLELDHATGKVGVLFLNQPIIHEPKLRTGHKNGGFNFRSW
jgi:broad specificity phosphatase PhoE